MPCLAPHPPASASPARANPSWFLRQEVQPQAPWPIPQVVPSVGTAYQECLPHLSSFFNPPTPWQMPPWNQPRPCLLEQHAGAD